MEFPYLLFLLFLSVNRFVNFLVEKYANILYYSKQHFYVMFVFPLKRGILSFTHTEEGMPLLRYSLTLAHVFCHVLIKQTIFVG